MPYGTQIFVSVCCFRFSSCLKRFQILFLIFFDILIIFFINSNFSSNLIPEIIKSGTFQEIVNYGVDLLDQMPRNINEI